MGGFPTSGSAGGASLQGTAVSSTAPADGQALIYSASATQWQPSAQGLIQRQSVTLSLATMQAAGAVTTHNFAIGGALPTNARIVGWYVGGTGMSSLDDATHATWNASITAASPGDIMGNVNVSVGQGTNPKLGTAGALGIAYTPASGAQLYVTVSSSVNLSTLTTGTLPAHLFYTVLP